MDGMGQVRLRASVLPARAAYLIKEGSVRGFRQAVREASTRWAGACEPIVPVSGRSGVDPAFDQIVRTSRVDGLVNVDAAPGMAARLGQTYGLPVIPLKRIDREGITRLTTHVAHLSHRQNPHASSAPLIACSGGALWEVAAAGDLSSEALEDMSAARLTPRRPRSSDEIAMAQLVRNNLIDLTTCEFAEHFTSGQREPSPALIWITEPDSLIDCVWFCNMRALRSLRFDLAPMVLLPATELQYWPGFDRRLQSALGRSVDIKPDALVRSFSLRPRRLREVALLLGLVEMKSPPKTQRVSPLPPRRSAPFTFAMDIDERQFLLHERRYGQQTDALVEMHRSGTTVRFASPINEANGHGRTLIQIASSIFDGLPRHPAVAALIHPHSVWAYDAVQIAVDNAARIDVDLRVPTWKESVETVLRSATLGHSLSDKGRIASRMHELAASRALLVPHAFDVVRRLTTPRSPDLLRALREARLAGDTDERLLEIASTWGGRVERRHLSTDDLVRDVGEGAVAAAEALTEDGWAERGLTVMCDRCGLRTFVRMESVGERAQCAACRAGQSYERSERSLLVSYRLNALLDRASDQGVVPHLLAVAAMATSDPNTHLLPGIDVICNDGKKAEIDLYGIYRGMVVVGEAKTSPEGFSHTQLARDMRLVDALNADAYVMACPARINPQSIVAAQAECDRWDFKLITVQGPSVSSQSL